MRTTVDIPDEALRLAKWVARSRGVTLGTLLGDLIEDRLKAVREGAIEMGPHGLPVFGAGRVVTADEVAELDKDG